MPQTTQRVKASSIQIPKRLVFLSPVANASGLDNQSRKRKRLDFLLPVANASGSDDQKRRDFLLPVANASGLDDQRQFHDQC
ncbi:MAG: hypothetical protein EBV06_11870 [Planctomycetia bacterium]|nr:hypothetical protein [Planctomycetia bacterium]